MAGFFFYYARTKCVRRSELVCERADGLGETRNIDASTSAAPETFARIARRFDLSIVAQPRPETSGTDEMLAEAALFGSGRPVLIVPYIQQAGLKLDRVMVCWDGSRVAARATADALPLLTRAGTTELVTVTDASSDPDEIPGIDIRRAPRAARHQGGAQADRPRRRRCRKSDPVTRRRYIRRSHRHGRLRSFAAARIRARRHDTGPAAIHDGSDIHVSLIKLLRPGEFMASKIVLRAALLIVLAKPPAAPQSPRTRHRRAAGRSSPNSAASAMPSAGPARARMPARRRSAQLDDHTDLDEFMDRLRPGLQSTHADGRLPILA